jgi:tetratricopeptide (TPR) repeat protein
MIHCRSKIKKQKAQKRVGKIFYALALSLLLANSFSWNMTAAESASRGKDALRSGDYAKALEYFENALTTAASPDESKAGLLQALRETGAYAAAVKRADEFLAASDNSSQLHLERGRLAEILGDYSDAEKHYRRSIALAVKQTSGRLDATNCLAGLLAKTGHRNDAEALWEQIIDEYRAGKVQGSSDLGNVAVAAWKRGAVESAKDIFIDATSPMIGFEPSLEALVNFGYLFLEKDNATEALGVFRDCLKINKSYPDALVGIALAKQDDSNAESIAYARSALKVNPNFAPALNLLAELALDEENEQAALEEIDKSLRVNPAELESLSLKAALHYLHTDKNGFAQIEKKVLELNPGYGNFYYILAENLVSRRKYQDAVEFYRKAVALDPELWAAYTSLGMNLARIGEFEEGRDAIQKAFAGDQYNVRAYNSLNLFDQMDTFVHSTSEHFNFLMSREDDPVLSSYASSLAEEAYSNLTERYGFKPEGPIHVEIFPDHGGFAVRTLGLPGLGGALGVCFGKVLAIDSPRARKVGNFNWGTTLWHEFTHVMSLQMSNYNIPRWFSEGLSVHEEHRARPGWGDRLNVPLLRAYKEGKLLKASQLNLGITHPQSPEQIVFSYYQAGMFCEMVEKKFGFDKLKQSLTLFAQNVRSEEVFRQTLGLDAAGTDAEYARYLDSQMKELASHIDFQSAEKKQGDVDKAALEKMIENNPDDFSLHLRMGALLQKEGSTAAAEASFKKAQKLFPQFVAEGNPYQRLGRIYLESKRNDEALAEFIAWSRLDGESTTPLLKAAEIYNNRKDWDSVARMLKLSIYINPYDQDAQKKLGEAAMESRRWPDAIAAYRVLVGLNAADPAGAHYDLARALFAAGDKQRAKQEVLRSLENAPGFRKAQELLLNITGTLQ